MNDFLENNENIIIYRDQNGKTKKAFKLFSFEHNDKNYIVFTEGEKDKNNAYKLNACIYDPNGIDLHLYPIESDFEWKMINEVYANVKKYVDEIMEKKVVESDEK